MEIIVMLLLIGANGLFAMAELAVVSSRKSRLEQRVEDGDNRAAIALELANAPTQFLATVQIGITLIGILVGVFGGAALADDLGSWLAARLPWIDVYADAISLGIIVVATTYLSLIFGELVPKRLAMLSPEDIAVSLAGPMQLLSRVASPAVRLLSSSTTFVVWLLGTKESSDSITAEDITAVLQQGIRAGVLLEAEHSMVERVFDLDERPISLLMTPRIKVISLDIEDPMSESLAKIASTGHTYYPVYRHNPDEVVGLVSAKSLLETYWRTGQLDLSASLIAPLYVPESASAMSVLELFKQSGVHAALVIDEHSGIEGIVTLTDFAEEIVGDIPLAGEIEEPQIIRRSDGSLLLDGMLPIIEVFELLDIEQADDDPKGYDTLGGFFMARAGGIPISGDSFEWQGFKFEVMDMDRLRVDKVLVSELKSSASQEE